MYQSLYRKYRPQTFHDLIGQENIVHALSNAIANINKKNLDIEMIGDKTWKT